MWEVINLLLVINYVTTTTPNIFVTSVFGIAQKDMESKVKLSFPAMAVRCD